MKYMIFILMLMLMAAPVAAVTYSEEYYTLGEDVNTWMYGGALRDMGYADVTFQLAELREIRRQTILMEKQNELLEEQNMLLRNLTNARFVGYYEQMTYAPAGYKVTT